MINKFQLMSLVIIVFVAGLMSGCDNSVQLSYSKGPDAVIYQAGDQFVAYKGDTVTPVDGDARVQVIQNVDEAGKSVTVLLGRVSLKPK